MDIREGKKASKVDEFLKKRFEIHLKMLKKKKYQKPSPRILPSEILEAGAQAEGKSDDDDEPKSHDCLESGTHRWLGFLFNENRELKRVPGNIYGDQITDSMVRAWVSGVELQYEIDFDLTLHNKEEWGELKKLIENYIQETPPLNSEAVIRFAKSPMGLPVVPYLAVGETYLQMAIIHNHRTEFFRLLHLLVSFILEYADKISQELRDLSDDQKKALEDIKADAHYLRKEMIKQNIPTENEIKRNSLRLNLERLRKQEPLEENERDILDKIEIFIMPKIGKHKIHNPGEVNNDTEFIVWGPHLFEKFLKHRIYQSLPRYGFPNFRVCVRNMKKGEETALTHDKYYQLRPDIMIIEGESIISIVDAKLYKQIWRRNKGEFAVKMDAYLNRFCAHKHGITFVALFGTEVNGNQTSPIEERGHHAIVKINIHKKEWNASLEGFEEALNKTFQFMETGLKCESPAFDPSKPKSVHQ